MANERGVMLSEGAAKTTAEMARWWRKQPKNEVGAKRRLYPESEDGGGTQIIRFVIATPLTYESPCEALAYVVSRPYGVSAVPGEYYGMVYVQDRVGCHLNAPAEDLEGRAGYAAYMAVDPELPPDSVAGSGEGTCPGLTTPGWEIMYMCCAQDRCDT